MGLFQKWATWIVRVSVGDDRQRRLLTPVIALIFLIVISIFIVAALLTDKWLHFPSITYLPCTLICGLALLVPGLLLYLWTVGLFTVQRGTPVPINPPRELIMTGPYAYSRNPMMLSIYLMFFSAGLLIGSLALTAIFTPLFILLMTLYARLVEEKELELRFGHAYLDYRKRVKMYIPGII